MKIDPAHSHLIFGIVQSGLTSGIASAIATFSGDGGGLLHWLASWLVSWAAMLPIVIFAAPFIKRLVDHIIHTTRS
ncbi:MAG: hypothetical protein RIQ68_52 [Pseudomonadota bacterium]